MYIICLNSWLTCDWFEPADYEQEAVVIIIKRYEKYIFGLKSKKIRPKIKIFTKSDCIVTFCSSKVPERMHHFSCVSQL